MRVAVLGSAGRMGSAVCEAVVDDQELDLVAAIDPSSPGQKDSTVQPQWWPLWTMSVRQI